MTIKTYVIQSAGDSGGPIPGKMEELQISFAKDVNISAPLSGDTLVYDGSKWVNRQQFMNNGSLWDCSSLNTSVTSIIEAKNGRILAIGRFGNGGCYSDDGVTFNDTNIGDNLYASKLAYSPELDMVCATFYAGDRGVRTSSNNGLTWDNRTVASGLNAVIWSETSHRFVCVGNNTAYTSGNGIDWVLRYTAEVANYQCLVEHGGIIVAMGVSGKKMYSTDGGETWIAGDAGPDTYRSVVWNPRDSRFYAVGDPSTNFQISLDGITFSAYQSIGGLGLQGLACSPSGEMVAAGSAVIFSSGKSKLFTQSYSAFVVASACYDKTRRKFWIAGNGIWSST